MDKLIITFDLADLSLTQRLSLTDVTVQPPCRMTSFQQKVEVNVQNNLQPPGATNSVIEVNIEFYCIHTDQCPQFNNLQKQFEDVQIHIGHFFAELNKLGISTDKESLEAYQSWSSDDHYHW